MELFKGTVAVRLKCLNGKWIGRSFLPAESGNRFYVKRWNYGVILVGILEACDLFTNSGDSARLPNEIFGMGID